MMVHGDDRGESPPRGEMGEGVNDMSSGWGWDAMI